MKYPWWGVNEVAPWGRVKDRAAGLGPKARDKRALLP
jgi:hypothetical protein